MDDQNSLVLTYIENVCILDFVYDLNQIQKAHYSF